MQVRASRHLQIKMKSKTRERPCMLQISISNVKVWEQSVTAEDSFRVLPTRTSSIIPSDRKCVFCIFVPSPPIHKQCVIYNKGSLCIYWIGSISISQTSCIRITLKTCYKNGFWVIGPHSQFLIQRSGMGLKNLHFKQVHREYQCC